MPGIVVFRRRWSVGSDDLVVPGLFLYIVHLIWAIVLGVLLGVVEFDRTTECISLLWWFVIGYMILLGLAIVNELAISVVALRGGILDTAPRASMQYLLYVRLGLLIIETGWLIAGVIWLVYYYPNCPIDKAKQTVLGLIVCNWCILVSIVVTVWCTYDAAGRSWVKMKKYQRSMRESESKYQYKRSGSTRNWRQRKVLRAYQDSWHQRCRFLFCCMSPSDRNRNSFTDIARLLSDFFRDLDVVPSDVIAGLVLLRKFQKIERKAIVEHRKNDTYEFLSGVAVTPRTQFLSLHEGQDLELFQTVIHFAHFAVWAYGWPIYIMTQKIPAVCRLCANLKCCCFPCQKSHAAEVVDDNCCNCNFAALLTLSEIGNIEVIYATYHCEVGETPFFVALDYDKEKIVISIRGTLSMQDILTDLNAEGETLPVTPVKEEWLGHKGMVQAAQYIYEKLKSENLIERALYAAPEKGTMRFKVVCVGHSLGAGTACILGILLKQDYPDLQSYCYSPPGGLLSMPAVEYTKSFTISVVIGKDVVPRIGLHQMEALRADLINAIKRSIDPKWKTIACSVLCCGCAPEPTSAVELSTGDANVNEYMTAKDSARVKKVHPADSSIALTSHQPLYPPGRIIHVVRHHPTKGEQALSKKDPVYQALWAQNTDFDEVLISPVMIQDHMPDTLLDALNKVITTLGPRKPQRLSISNPSKNWNDYEILSSPTPQHRVYLETSFTSLQSPSGAPSNASSVTNGYFSTISEPSPLPLTNVLHFLNKRTRSHQDIQVHVHIDRQPAKSLSLNLRRLESDPSKKIDLIHDDWFGLAPLASPESLSELSSISSRASFNTNLEKIQILGGSYELKTPKVMRRTPKINNNLSTCADDIKNVRYYQKLGQLSKHLRMPANNGGSMTNSSSNLSFESAGSSSKGGSNGDEVSIGTCTNIQEEVKIEVPNVRGETDDFQSVEDILDSVMETAGCADYFNSTTTFLETHFDESMFPEESVKSTYTSSPSILSPCTPVNDPDIISNFAIDLNLDLEHRSTQYTQLTTDTSKPNSIDSGSICRTPSDAKNVTFNPQVINIEENFSPVHSPRKKKWTFMPTRHKSVKVRELPVIHRTEYMPKTILCTKRRNSSEEFFSRTEALPLLSNLSANSERTSPNFVRRKKYVYPTVTFISKGESSV